MEHILPRADYTNLQRRRLLAARRVERERRRMELLESCMSGLNKATQLREWMQRLADGRQVEPTVQRMLKWAHGQASLLEAKAAAEMDQAGLGDLFPETDDLHDPLGDPAPRHPWAL